MARPRPLRADDYPADPYPGSRPDFSFVQCPDDRLEPFAGPVPTDRIPVLAYGSNACPSKISWLRSALGLRGAVTVLRCTTVGISAVWAAGRRQRDGQVPAVLVETPGIEEVHAVWLATDDQIEVLDRCEGARYRRTVLGPPVEIRAGTTTLHGVQAYVAAVPERAPMLHRGRVVSITAVDQSGAQELLGQHRPG